MKLNIIILAAGFGKRMRSSLPKVLHKLAGQTLLERVVNTAKQLNPECIHVVYGHGGEIVRKNLSHLSVHWVEQKEQLGTGHAVAQVAPYLPDDGLTLVLFADGPLITASTLDKLIKTTPAQGLGLLVTKLDDPTGLGRITLDSSGKVRAIIEEKDATQEQKLIKEIFSGIIAMPTDKLKHWLPQLTNDNAQGEYYLTQIPTFAIAENISVIRVYADCPEEVMGVNNKQQLAELERFYQRQKADELMLAGTYLADPNRLDVRGTLEVGKDVSIDINVIFEGIVKLGDGCHVGANTIIRNATIGQDVQVKENCVIEDAVIESGSTVGPFARLRPQAHLQQGAHVGNFVEIKKSTIGVGSKVNHLSYVGDSNVGADVNIGAGTITCNYDGAYKHLTTIEDHCFIGSGTQLVAPVTIAEGATIGAGSTITRDTPAGQLTISRAKQATVPNWQRPQKKEKDRCVE